MHISGIEEDFRFSLSSFFFAFFPFRYWISLYMQRPFNQKYFLAKKLKAEFVFKYNAIQMLVAI